MRVLEVDPKRPDGAVIRVAARILRGGGIVAFPTETVYGLGGNALDEATVEKIFRAKGRPGYNPLIAHCANADAARALAAAWPAEAELLAGRFWPGPLTLVLPKRPEVPDRLTAGLGSVAVRVPANPVALALLDAVGFPIAAPSANPFTRLSPTSAGHVAKSLGDRIDLILDAGPTTLGIESTVIDLTGEEPVLLRHGTIPVAEIEAALGRPLATAPQRGPTEARPSPGMVAKHYSPHAALHLLPADEIRKRLRTAAAPGVRIAAIFIQGSADGDSPNVVHLSDSPAEYARRIYAALHDLDDLGIDEILVEAPPSSPEWSAVRDRLTRAATPG